jgi:hypothetical protein
MMDVDRPGVTQSVAEALGEAVLLASAVEVTCIGCGAFEMALPLDCLDEPLSDEFVARYLCSDCEEALPSESVRT